MTYVSVGEEDARQSRGLRMGEGLIEQIELLGEVRGRVEEPTLPAPWIDQRQGTDSAPESRVPPAWVALAAGLWIAAVLGYSEDQDIRRVLGIGSRVDAEQEKEEGCASRSDHWEESTSEISRTARLWMRPESRDKKSVIHIWTPYFARSAL